jgi:sarcosine oxidase/sarcosine oxidase subunit beta
MLPLTASVAALLEGRTARPRRVAVVGGGILGLGTAWALARRGHAVTLLEAGALPDPAASSYDEGRIIRHAYGTMEGYAAMMPAAFAAWRALFAETGADRLVPLRAVYALRAPSPWEDAVARTQARQGLGYRLLDDAELDGMAVLDRGPLLRAVEVDGSGMLRAAPILADLLGLLARLGVVLRAQAPVARFDRGAPVLADGTRVAAEVTVVAAGAGVLALLPEAAAAAGLRASLQTLAYLDPPPDLAAAWARAPMLLCRLPGHPAGGAYVLPPRDGTRLKLGDYDTSCTVDPAAPRMPLRQDRLDALLDAGRQAIARFDAHRVTAARHCLYTMAPEDRFVVAPAAPGVILASACSGHGFKLAPLLGLGLTALVEERLSVGDAAFWVAGREGEASPPPASA